MVSPEDPSFAAPADPRGGHAAMVEEGMYSAQRHDRIEGLKQKRDPRGGPGSGNVEITLAQKMMSAVSGSIFTSLLGMAPLSICSR